MADLTAADSTARLKLHPGVLVGLATAALCAGLIAHGDAPLYSSDSASYIEQARNLLGGHGLVARPFGLAPEQAGAAPDEMFPPGYPLLIASLGLFGLEPHLGALAIAWMSSLLLPLALFLSFRHALGDWGAATLALLGGLSRSVIAYGGMGLSDAPALLLSVIAIGLVLKSRTAQALFIAGLIAGFSYVVRNAQSALIAACSAYFLIAFVCAATVERAKIFKQGAAFALGCAVILAPYILYNLATFGAINPYHMPPSTISFWINLRDFLTNAMRDVLASPEGPILRLTHHALGLLAVFAAIAGAMGFAVWRWKYLGADARRAAILCGLYVLAGAAVVIIARSVYQWGEPINLRHVLPYTPFVFAATLAVALPSDLQSKHAPWRLAMLAGFALLIVIRVAGIGWEAIARTPPDPAIAAFETGAPKFCGRTDNALLISNFAYSFRIECDAAVRHPDYFNLDSDPAFRDFIAAGSASHGLADGVLAIDAPSDRPVLIGLYPGRRGVNAEDLPLSQADAAALQAAGWRLERNDERGLELERPAADHIDGSAALP